MKKVFCDKVCELKIYAVYLLSKSKTIYYAKLVRKSFRGIW